MDLESRFRDLAQSAMRKISIDTGWFILFFLLGVISRIPFRSQIAHHWDSVNFVLAIDNFDISLHQPHPPGTFVLYVLLGRLINIFLNDPHASLVWISVVLSGFCVSTVYLLGRRIFNRNIGVIVAILMLTSPLVWFHGEIALTYVPELLWVTIMGIFFYDALRGDERAMWFATLSLGLAGGIRPNTPVFLFPLWIYVVIRQRPSFKKLMQLIIILSIGVLLWVVPLLIMVGGFGEYLELFDWWLNQHVTRSAGANPVVYMIRFSVYIIYTLGIAILPILLVLVLEKLKPFDGVKTDLRTHMLFFWAAPGTLYFLLIHLKQPGHIFTILPVIFLLAGLAIQRLLKSLAPNSIAYSFIVGILVVGNGIFFLFGPEKLGEKEYSLLILPTRAAIMKYDEEIEVKLSVIREEFSPDETIIIAGDRNFRIPDYYLPEYPLTSASYLINDNAIVVPDGVRTIIFFDEDIMPAFQEGDRVNELILTGGYNLRYLHLSECSRANLRQEGIDVEWLGFDCTVD